MSDAELENEQAYIDDAYRRLDELRDAARAAIGDVIDLGRGGTFQSRTERDVVVRTSLARLEQLDIGNQPLCFGRIDTASDERFYIGRLGVSGRDQEPLVVDWRAPIAEPFYRATGRFPMGITRRRHFQLHGRRLVALEDEPLVVTAGDEAPLSGRGALLSALEQRRSGRMSDIVATIQGEQDEIIRAPLPGVLVVQGGPGTGKTAVALHRAAYLLYTHRFPLERQGVLVVGPNPVFLRYIGHVLPSLGETGVELSTVSRLVHDAKVRGVDSRRAAIVKGDPRMATVIARAVRNRQRPLRSDVVLGYGSYRLRFGVADSEEVVAAVRRRGNAHNPRRRRFERLVNERLYAKYAGAVERSRHRDPGTSELDLERFVDALRELPEYNEMLDRMWPKLSPVELIHDLFGARPLIELATRNTLSKDEAASLYRGRSTSLEEIPWTDGDMALIDEARVALGPVKPLVDDEQLIPAFGHVVVDEAQDLSPMQLRMLGRRSIGGSVTIVGDIAQATGPWAPSKWTDVLEHFPHTWTSNEVELTIGYRTPAEAMSVAAHVLEATGLDLTPPRPVRESGHRPVVSSVVGSRLAGEVVSRAREEMAAVGDGTVGVVVPDSLTALVVAAFDEAEVAYGTNLDSQVTLLSPALVKGLEFDSVVVVEPTSIVEETPHGLRSLYVALTRTTLRLTVVHSRELPASLVDMSAR